MCKWWDEWYSTQKPAEQLQTSFLHTRYFFHPLAAQRAYDLLPDTRILVLLRNPIKRILSHYNMDFQIRIQQGGWY